MNGASGGGSIKQGEKYEGASGALHREKPMIYTGWMWTMDASVNVDAVCFGHLCAEASCKVNVAISRLWPSGWPTATMIWRDNPFLGLGSNLSSRVRV